MPALIAMCGLPFAGKSVLAGALSRELRIRVLSYDFGIYPVVSRLAPAGSSVAAEYDFVQDIARREIGAILAGGESLIYDDLLLERDHRRKLAAVAEAHWAGFVLVYLDTPLSVIDDRRTANSRTRARTSVPEGKMREDISLLEPLLTILGPGPSVYDQLGIVPGRHGNRSPNNAPRNTYVTRDGRWVAISQTRISVPEARMRLDISLFEPPEDAERAVYVSPDYVLPEVLARVSARLTGH